MSTNFFNVRNEKLQKFVSINLDKVNAEVKKEEVVLKKTEQLDKKVHIDSTKQLRFEKWLNKEYDEEFKLVSESKETETKVENNDRFHYETSLKEGDINNWEAMQKAIKDMGLRETYCRGVYCEMHNPSMPAGNYTHQRHYVWNDATQEMVELPNIYYLSKDGREAKNLDGYEEIQAYAQGFRFTETDGIYTKGGKNYTFNVETNEFTEIQQKERINTTVLFGNLEEISPRYLFENLNSLKNSDDVNIAKFAQILDDLTKEYGINNNYDQEDLFKCVIMLMNKSAGTENTYPVTLTKNTVEKLNEKGFFEELDKIAKSQDLKNEYYFGVDGYIDNFRQNTTGDCWLLASILALCSSDAGKDIIKDSIEKITKKDEYGNNKEYIRVTFKGIGIHYDISYEEMLEARVKDGEFNSAYSDGDNDVQAIELATEKLRRDLASGNILLPYGSFSGGNPEQADDGNGGILYGGSHEDMLFYLTGNTSLGRGSSAGLSQDEVLPMLNDLYEGFINGTLAGYLSFGGNDAKAKTVDGKEFTWSASSYHAFAIVDMTITEPNDPKKNTVTIANPWYPDKTYTFTWDEFSKIKPYEMGMVSTELHEHHFIQNNNDKTNYGNNIDYDSKIKIEGVEYSIKDILESKEPIQYKTTDFIDTAALIYEIAGDILSDIQPDIRNKIIGILGRIYSNLANSLDLDDPDDGININGEYVIRSSMANDFGVIKTDNGTAIDIRTVVQKAIDYVMAYLREPLSLDEYETKLQNGEFDKQVDEIEIKLYLSEYRELLINDMLSKYEYSDDYIKVIRSWINLYTSSLERDENGKFNLQDVLNTQKSKFEKYTNPPTEEITSYNIEVSWTQGIGSVKNYINDIVRFAYDSNKDKIQAKDLDDFKKQLIQYIALKYGMAEELQKNGVINLSNITDTNGDGNWVDEFYQIVQDFAHKDDDAKINYYRKFEINGQEYTINDILSSKNSPKFRIMNIREVEHYIKDIVESLSDLLQNIDSQVVKNIKNTLFMYYYTFTNLAFDSDIYYDRKEVTIHNYITGQDDNVWFDIRTAMEFGINAKNGYYVEIDLKILIQKLIEMVEQATGSI